MLKTAMTRIRLLPVLIFFCTLTLTVRVHDIWVNVDGIIGGSVELSGTEAQAQTQPPPQPDTPADPAGAIPGLEMPTDSPALDQTGLIVPEEVAHWFRRVRTGSKPPPGGWGTQTRLHEFSIGQYFDRHRLPLRIVEHPAPEIPDLETFLALVACHLERGDDVVACSDRQYLFGTGDREHVTLIQAVDRRFVVLVDPAEDSPDLCQVPANQLFETLHVREIGRFGLWVISSRSDSGEFR